jgi:tetratricopeptide (TPR) repeat protein
LPIRPEAVEVFNRGCAALISGALVDAVSCFRTALMIDPQSADARYNLACALQRAGDIRGALDAYRRCATDHPEDVESGENLANLLMDTGDYREALTVLESLRVRFPERSKLLANLALARWRVRLAAESGRDAGRERRRILVACMPKSGSTFLADVLAKLPGMQRAHLVPAYGRREQELDLEQLASHQGSSYVCQLHLRPSALTLELLDAFAIRPLVLYRNIWDVMASLRDHMHHHSLDWSMARVDPAFRSWEEGRQYEFLARAMMPWFIDFYVSWAQIPGILAVSYEALMADPVAMVARVADWAGMPASQSDIAQALAATGRSATFNKGGSGRGKSVPESARAHVRALAGFYPDIDFTPLLGDGSAAVG